MISALHRKLTSQSPSQEDQTEKDMFLFTVEHLLNPLKEFGNHDDDHDSSGSLLSSICTSCELCQNELNRLVSSEYEEDQESGMLRCKQCVGRRVRFAPEEDNTVISIPSFRDYSEEEFKGMWASHGELDENAHRNRMEYQFEGHWKLVLEEDRFIRCSDGVLYHPVTVRLHLRYLQKQRVWDQKEQKKRLAERKRKLVLVEGSKKKAKRCASAPPRFTGNKSVHRAFRRTTPIIVPNMLIGMTVPRLTACVA